MSENKTVILIDDKSQRMFEVKEKKVPETHVVAVKETYAVIKLGEWEVLKSDELFTIFLEYGIQYRIVEVVEQGK